MSKLLSDKDTAIVVEILCDQLNVSKDQVTQEARLEDDLCADSLDLVQITMALEEQLEVTVPDDRAEEARTVGGLFELVADLQQVGR